MKIFCVWFIKVQVMIETCVWMYKCWWIIIKNVVSNYYWKCRCFYQRSINSYTHHKLWRIFKKFVYNAEFEIGHLSTYYIFFCLYLKPIASNVQKINFVEYLQELLFINCRTLSFVFTSSNECWHIESYRQILNFYTFLHYTYRVST